MGPRAPAFVVARRDDDPVLADPEVAAGQNPRQRQAVVALAALAADDRPRPPVPARHDLDLDLGGLGDPVGDLAVDRARHGAGDVDGADLRLFALAFVLGRFFDRRFAATFA